MKKKNISVDEIKPTKQQKLFKSVEVLKNVPNIFSKDIFINELKRGIVKVDDGKINQKYKNKSNDTEGRWINEIKQGISDNQGQKSQNHQSFLQRAILKTTQTGKKQIFLTENKSEQNSPLPTIKQSNRVLKEVNNRRFNQSKLFNKQNCFERKLEKTAYWTKKLPNNILQQNDFSRVYGLDFMDRSFEESIQALNCSSEYDQTLKENIFSKLPILNYQKTPKKIEKQKYQKYSHDYYIPFFLMKGITPLPITKH